jgi:quercetin dioxygenase-like cupin family protein
MVFFSTGDAPQLMQDGIMSAPYIDPAVWAEVDLGPWLASQEVSVPFKSTGPDQFSLVYSRFAPGFRLPRHSHSADCLYYVLSGEFTMGTRTFRKGDGFFVQAGAPYAYTAGPEGLEILEFRTSTSFDMKILDQTPERWRAIVGSLAPEK